MKGVLNLYKPKGITSSDAVVSCRKILGTKAIGHMGTLDPAGEGVLLLGVGKATRLFDYYLKKDKEYEAEFCFGYATDTLDGDGIVIETTDNIPKKEDIIAVLREFEGKQMQIPPQYSAKSIGGVRAYKLARNGGIADLQACEVEIHRVELIKQTAKNTYLMRICCSAGTYIRSVCRDIAKRLNSCATMISIKRTVCGRFSVENAVSMETLEKLKEEALISVEEALEELPKLNLPDDLYVPLCNGIKIKALSEENVSYALYCKGELFGIAENVGGILKIKTYLRD